MSNLQVFIVLLATDATSAYHSAMCMQNLNMPQRALWLLLLLLLLLLLMMMTMTILY